jgi:hypothetical protein
MGLNVEMSVEINFPSGGSQSDRLDGLAIVAANGTHKVSIINALQGFLLNH